MFIKFNSNPYGSRVGDCVVRAISTAMNMEWEDVYMDLAERGLSMGDMPSSNHVWGSYLQSKGFEKYGIPDTCPDCYTVKDFCNDAPYGIYVLGTGTHAVCVMIDENGGRYFDAWDSGDEIPIICYRKEY